MSAREWKPGDVGVTAHGRLALRRESHPARWMDSQGAPWSNDEFPTNVRPLVVIDPEDRTQVDRLASALFGRHFDWKQPMECHRIDTQAALRSLVTPPKPKEPTGLGAVVKDTEGRLYIRTSDTDCHKPWSHANNYDDHEYRDIDVAEVLSEGVTP